VKLKKSYAMNTAQASNLVNNIPKFCGQKEEIQLEEFVRQIEDFADLVQWTHNVDGENEEICYLFQKVLTGKADQIWRFFYWISNAYTLTRMVAHHELQL
jgi:hypothetical protein